MNHEQDVEWTADERAMLARLPRERNPDPALKDRVRAHLRARGVFARGRPSTWLRMAAGLAVFLAGALAGSAITRGSQATVVLAADSELAPAERIQAAGTEYVQTIARLAELRGSIPQATMVQGRDAAISALRGAAEFVARLPGHDPEMARLLVAVRGVRGP